MTMGTPMVSVTAGSPHTDLAMNDDTGCDRLTATVHKILQQSRCLHVRTSEDLKLISWMHTAAF